MTTARATAKRSGPPARARRQPIATVEWLDPARLSANAWNPNIQAPPEHELLRISLLENGWTQPIVAREEDERLEIVDGYHRWHLASVDQKVADLTDGLVPVVRLRECPPEVARMATIRHNRARGTHYVVKMAEIIAELLALGLTREQIGTRLQMDPEEVDRLADRGVMPERAAAGEFGNGWTTT